MGQLVRAALGLGANLGDRPAALQTAVDQICANSQVLRASVSRIFQTTPVGGPAQADYYNAVLVVDTELNATELLALGIQAEESLLRTRDVRWEARTLDVDVLAVGDKVSSDPKLILPHPRAAERGFVLAPWAEVDPDFTLGGTGQTVAELLAALPARSLAGVTPLDVLFLHTPDGHSLVE